MAAAFDGSQVFARSVAEAVAAAARALRIPLEPAWYNTPSSGRLSLSSDRGPFLVTSIRLLTADVTYGKAIGRVEANGRLYVADAALVVDSAIGSVGARSPNECRALEAPIPVEPGGSLVVRKPEDGAGDAIVFGYHVRSSAHVEAILARTGVAWARGTSTITDIVTDREVLVRAVVVGNVSDADARLSVEIDGVKLTPTPLLEELGVAFTSNYGVISIPKFALHIAAQRRIRIVAPPRTTWPAGCIMSVVGVAKP